MSKIDFWLDDFLSYLASEKGLAKNTLKAYGSDLALFLTYLESRGSSDIAQIRKDLIVDFLAKRQKEGMASSSLARILVAIKMFCRFLKREKAISSNEADWLESPKIWQLIPEVLTRGAEAIRMPRSIYVPRIEGSCDFRNFICFRA
jgi:integrase/recombinase XerD